MSSRKTHRITELRRQNERLRRMLRILAYNPSSPEAEEIVMKLKMTDAMRKSISKMMWLGTYGPKA